MKFPGAPLRAEVVMTDGWVVLEQAIPRGEADAVAVLMNLSAQAVRSWRREPEANDELATGRRSPLDQILQLINAVYTRNPEGAEMIIDRIVSEIARLRKIHGHSSIPSSAEVEGELRQISRRTAQLADAVAGESEPL